MQVPIVRCGKMNEKCDYSSGDGMGCMGSAVIVMDVGLRARVGLCPEHASQVIGQMVEKMALTIPEQEDRRTCCMNSDPEW